jgi:ABC-2 type transport system permease protein
MTALALRLPRAARTKILATEARLALREPALLFWGVAFPVVLLVILGIASDTPEKDLGGLRVVDVYVPIMIAFVLAMLALNAIPPALAGYRERGVLRRLSTTPAPPWAVLGAQLVVAAALGVVALIVILAVGRIAFDVGLPDQVPAYLLTLLLTTAAILGLGLVVAAVAPSARAANAIGAILFFPLMFFAGLWIPRGLMPDALRAVSDYTPLGAAVEALQDATGGSWPGAVPLCVLAAYALAFGFAANRLFRWE